MRFLIISGSLSPTSRSRIMAQRLEDHMGDSETRFVDLRGRKLPVCDGSSVYGEPAVKEISRIVDWADGIVVATPVYNYGVSASVKNLVELTGDAWANKVVGLLLAAGGMGSYMGAMPFLNSLMLDFHAFILPRFVYASGRAFTDGSVTDPEVESRIAALALEWKRVTHALREPRDDGVPPATFA